MFIIVIDAHSKWIEAHPLSCITPSITILHLHQIFKHHGLVVVTDNGRSFIMLEIPEILVH